MLYRVPQGKKLPWSCSSCTAVVIESDMYIFGGGISFSTKKSLLWMLTRCLDGSFDWNIIHDNNLKGTLPLTRKEHSAWEYGNKMWILGGYLVNSSLPTDELLCFDPSIQAWSTPTCSGDIPSPQIGASSAIIDHTVWLYGNEHNFDLGTCMN